jgi:zinc protease
MELMFNNSLNSQICGTVESVQSITRKNLIDFNKKFYAKDKLLLTYCGPIEHEYLANSLVEKYFGKSDNILNTGPVFKSGKSGKQTIAEVIKEDQMQDTISISYTSPKFKTIFKNRAAAIAVFSVLFGRGEISRLFSKVREDLGLVYNIDCTFEETNDGIWFSINTMTEPDKYNQVLMAIDKEIAKIIKTPPTKNEVASAKNMIRSAMYSIESSYGMASQIVQHEMFGKKVGDDFIKDVNKISANDIWCVAKDIFSAKRYLVVGTGKSKFNED